MLFVRVAVLPLLLLTPGLSLGQVSSSGSSYLLRLARVTDAKSVCVLLQQDGHYHFERTFGDTTGVYEGLTSSANLAEIQAALNNDDLRQLTQEKIVTDLVASSPDALDLRVSRGTQWQQLRFPDETSRKPFHQPLNALLKWLDALPTSERVELSEDAGKNNCLPPPAANVQLSTRGENADGVPARPVSMPADSYMLRILMDQISPGEFRRTCAIVYPNGFYHLEKSQQTFAGGVYRLDAIYQGLGGKTKAAVFEQFLDVKAVEQLRKLLEDPELKASRHTGLPPGHYTDADINVLFIPRDTGLQELTFSSYFATEDPQANVPGAGARSQHVDSGSSLLTPLQKWLKGNLESRKAARSKSMYGDNCTPLPQQVLPFHISSELAQAIPSDLDTSTAQGNQSISAADRPATAANPPVAMPAANSEERPALLNEPAVSLRVTTRMVVLDVLATNKSGEPITDLRQSDVKLLEDGQAQNIKLFSRVSSESLRAAQRSLPTLPANVYSNRPEYRQPPGPLVLILLDGLNTAVGDQISARRQLLEFLRTLQSDQRAAIFALDSSLVLLQDFTSNPEKLSAALQKYSSSESLLLARGSPALITPQMAQDLWLAGMLDDFIRFNQENAVNASDERVRVTLGALRTVAQAMIGYPGRKNLIWVSSGFPLSIQLGGQNSDQSRSYSSELTSTAALLSQAHVAVYPVDARGLISNLPERPNTIGDHMVESEIVPTVESSDPAKAGMDSFTHTAPVVADSHFAMEQVARDTGGRAFYNVNNLAKVVATGIQDGSSYYTLGYYPENKSWDGRFRSITLQTERKEVKLRYRPGYYAFASANSAGPPDKREENSRLAELVRASRAPLPATGITFWADLIPPRDGDTATYLEFLVDAGSISFVPTGSGHDCNLDFAAFIVAPNGSILKTAAQNVDSPLPDALYAQVRTRGLPFRMRIDSLPKEGELRLAVRDNRTGLLGTLTIPSGSAQANVR